MLYLNDDFEGGETNFPVINLTVRPQRGMALFWHNVDGAQIPDNKTLHQALPVIRGVKIACNLWVLGTVFR